jgi:uncharacterized membrane protein YgcG
MVLCSLSCAAIATLPVLYSSSAQKTTALCCVFYWFSLSFQHARNKRFPFGTTVPKGAAQKTFTETNKKQTFTLSRSKTTMGNWSKTKLLTNLVVVVAVLVIGAGVVMAARGGNIVPFTSSSGDAHSAQATEAEQHDQNEFHAHGMIQTITFDQGTTSSGSLDFLPDGQQATVTVDFTAQTHVEVKGGLQTNVAVRIEGTKQSDGSVLAKEINDNADEASNDQNDDQDQEDQKVSGTIQSVDTTAQTFVLQPDGQTATMTIAYDKNTNIEDEHDNASLAAGQHVVVEVVKRADGSFYAKEIKNGQEDGQDGSDDGGSSGSGSSGSGSSGSGSSGSGKGGSGGDDDGGH